MNKRTVHAFSATVTDLPRDIPHGQRGGFPQAHLTAQLKALAPADATVTVTVAFHRALLADCHLPHETSA